jgi:phosphoribosyl 1,2-cyclic phosphodiesterase
VEFCPLASGSKGNCLYLRSEKTRILIDAGLSAKATAERLATLGVKLEDIQAILITHDHADHIKGVATLAGRLGIPVFANSDTARGILEANGGVLLPFKIFSTGETFTFADLEIHPFTVQHDTLDPVAFTIKTGNTKLGICTDLGCVTTLVRSQLQECDYLFVEANHQPSMVHACNRPAIYKQRVLSRQGHLSNEECADLVASILHNKLKHVYLAHLSSECNNPDLALMIVQEKLKSLGASVDVTIALQNAPSAHLRWEA